MQRYALVFLVWGIAIGAGAASAATLTVDGIVSDWGFSVADNNASTFVPAGGLNILGLFVEDQDDNAGDGGFVGPNNGGQNYDGEAIVAAAQSGNLFIAITSGQRPDNGFARYGPGDIRIVTSGGVYGIEVGGGAGGGAGGLLVGGDPGSTYTLDGNGFTTAHAAAAALQTAGSVWLNPTWILDPIPPQEQVQFQIGGGTLVGNAAYAFTRNTLTAQHANIELAIPFSVFGGEVIQSISWHPSCGNDDLTIALSAIPEPSTAVLAGLGLVGCLALVRRKRQPG